MLSKKCIVLLMFILAGQSLLAQTKKQRLSEIMKAYHNYNMFDGAILVAENGKIIYKDAFGLDINELLDKYNLEIV